MKIEVKIPSVGESITEATIAEWMKETGEFVKQNDVLLSLETDKANVEVVAEQDGILEILEPAESIVTIGATVARIDTEGKESKEQRPLTTKPKTSPSPKPQAIKSEPPLSPAVRRILREKQTDPSQIMGTGKGGRITKQDAMGVPSPAFTGAHSDRKKMSTIRRRIAQRLVEAQQTAAILTTFNEVDMGAIMALRKKHKETFEKNHGVKLGFMSFFTKACIEALKEYPSVNAFIDGDDIVYNHQYNIGIAVGAPRGLVVPVIKNAGEMSFAEIESTIRNAAQRASENKLTIDEISGGTFTISNGGTYGSLLSTPILNPPQSGILGMHKIEERPMVVDGKIVIRKMMYLALSYDHRIIDGKEAVSFLVKVKEALENPKMLGDKDGII